MNKLNRIKRSILSVTLMVGSIIPFIAPLMSEGISISHAAPRVGANGSTTTGSNTGSNTGSTGLGISNIPNMTFGTDANGNVIIEGGEVTSDTNAALGKAVKFIKWIAAAGTILLLGVFIINLLKIGASGTNVQARAAAQQGLIWSGIATAAMSVASTIFFFLQGILV